MGRVSSSDAGALITTCYLARHCDVANPGRVVYGHLPNFPLSERGRGQAVVLGRFLHQSRIRAIYTSPLQRAQETATLVAQELRPRPAILVRTDLAEAEFGRYLQGIRHQDVIWRRPGWLVHMVWPGLLPGDEPVATMAARVERVLEEGRRDHGGHSFLCISHGDPIQAFWASSDGRWPWALHHLQCAKGGLLELRYQAEELISKTYLSPEELAARVEASPRRRRRATS